MPLDAGEIEATLGTSVPNPQAETPEFDFYQPLERGNSRHDLLAALVALCILVAMLVWHRYTI